MPVHYKQAFGLSDNPFGPRLQVGQVPPPLTREMEIKPLLVHQVHQDVDKDQRFHRHYCDEIASFKSARAKLETLLELDNYTLDPPARGVASYMVAIEGDQGAGKTTLASRMLEIMCKRAPKDAPWHLEELWLRSKTQTADDQAVLLKELEKRVLVSVSKMPYSCILVDDLLADAYTFISQMYDNITSKCVAFLVFTSSDPKMSEQLDKAFHNVQRFHIGPLTPDDAIAYLKSRYQIYRIESSNGLSALPLFPFDENDIRTAVEVRAWRGSAKTGPVNLRLFASILFQALLNQLQEIAKARPNFDVNKEPLGILHELQIKLAQSYKVVTRL